MTVFEKFDDINSLPLRVFNRVVFMNNLFSDSGKRATEEYIKMFDDGEKLQMYLMGALIKSKGQDFIRQKVTKGLEVVDEVYN